MVKDAGREAPGVRQFEFLNHLRKQRKMVNLFLSGGARLTGRIASFDHHTLLLETRTGPVLVEHHAVSTVQAAAAPRASAGPRARRAAPAQPAQAEAFDEAAQAPGPKPPAPPQVRIVRRVRRTIAAGDAGPPSRG